METTAFTVSSIVVYSDRQDDVNPKLVEGIDRAIHKARTEIAAEHNLSFMRASLVRTETVTSHHWTETVRPNHHGYPGPTQVVEYYASVTLIFYFNIRN